MENIGPHWKWTCATKMKNGCLRGERAGRAVTLVLDIKKTTALRRVDDGSESGWVLIFLWAGICRM